MNVIRNRSHRPSGQIRARRCAVACELRDERLGRPAASRRRGRAAAVRHAHGAHRRRARLWRRAAAPAARHPAQPALAVGAGAALAICLAERDRRRAHRRLLRRLRHRQRHGRPACRARRRCRLGAGRQAAQLRPRPCWCRSAWSPARPCSWPPQRRDCCSSAAS